MASTNEPVPASDVREEAQSPLSDNDGGERPVRQQLKQTSIQSTPLTTATKENGRKRSFDESRDDQANPDENGEAPRKRSREGTPQDESNIEATTMKDASAGAKSENVSDNVSFPVLAPLEMADKTLQSSPTSPRSSPASAVPSVRDPHPILDFEEDCLSQDWKSEMDKEIASIIESWRSKKANRVAKRAGRTGRPDKREADANSDADWADVYESIRRQLYKVDVERSRSASRSGSLQPAAEEATGRGASESSFDSVHEVLEGLPSSPTVQEFTSDNSFDFVREYLEGLPSSSLAPATPRDDSFEYVREYLEGMPSSSMAPASPSDGGDEGDEGDEDDEEEAGPNEDEFGDEESGDDDSGDADSWVTPSTPSTTSTPSGCSRSDLIWDHREEKMTPAGAYADLWARYCRETKANKNLQDPETSTANEIPDTTMHASDESTQSLNKKRSLEQLEDGSKKFDTIKPSAREPPSDTAGIKSTTDGEPEKKRHRDNSQEPEPKADNGFASSAFGKAVGASPFASLGNTQESNFVSKTTSPSPFADSSFASYAASVNSPFCPPAASKPSVFMSAPAGSNSFASAPATSGFGGMGGGFAGFSGGFAAAAKPGLTSFASNNAPPTFGETKAKPLGADDSDDDESDGDGDEDGSSTFEAAKTDERFYEQTVETGEEQEETVFTCKAKLFHFSNKEWKERGIGTFKINVRQTADGNEAGRMIMRADGAGRVILNSPIFKGMNYGGPDNSAPASKQILLAGTEEGRTVPLLLRTQSEATAVDLYDVIDDLLADPSTTSANTSTSA